MVYRRGPSKHNHKAWSSDGPPEPGDYGVFLAEKGRTYGGVVAERDGLGLALNSDGDFYSIICWDAESACLLIAKLQLAAQDVFGCENVLVAAIKAIDEMNKRQGT